MTLLASEREVDMTPWMTRRVLLLGRRSPDHYPASWWHRRQDISPSLAHLDLVALDEWEQHCRPDARWVMSRVRQAGG